MGGGEARSAHHLTGDAGWSTRRRNANLKTDFRHRPPEVGTSRGDRGKAGVLRDSRPCCVCGVRMSYTDKLLDPRWQRCRLEVLNRDGWECTDCGDGENTLHVHHLYYEWGLDPWEYPPEALRTLCDTCHKQAKVNDQRLKAALKTVALRGWRTEEIALFLESCNGANYDGMLDLAFFAHLTEGLQPRQTYIIVMLAQALAELAPRLSSDDPENESGIGVFYAYEIKQMAAAIVRQAESVSKRSRSTQ